MSVYFITIQVQYPLINIWYLFHWYIQLIVFLFFLFSFPFTYFFLHLTFLFSLHWYLFLLSQFIKFFYIIYSHSFTISLSFHFLSCFSNRSTSVHNLYLEKPTLDLLSLLQLPFSYPLPTRHSIECTYFCESTSIFFMFLWAWIIISKDWVLQWRCVGFEKEVLWMNNVVCSLFHTAHTIGLLNNVWPNRRYLISVCSH